MNTKSITPKQEKQYKRFVEDVAERALEEAKLDKDGLQRLISNGGKFQADVVAFIKKYSACPGRLLMVLKLGTGLETADDFRKALKNNRYRFSYWANDIMSQPDFAQSLAKANPEQKYDLVVLTTAQFTGNGKGTTAKVFAGAKRLGLEKCPAWMGPKLRLDYQGQPNNEWILIGMEPIADSGGNHLDMFSVESIGSGLWLDVHCDTPGDVWGPGTQWVFVRPRK